MFLILVYLHYKIAEAFKVLLFLLLLLVDSDFDQLASEVRMHVKQGQEKFVDGSFGEEEIMIDDDCFLIIIDELLVALS